MDERDITNDNDADPNADADADADANGNDDALNKNRCNPFIIQKRRILALNTELVHVFKKQIPLDIFYDFIERMGGPPVESSKIMHVLKSGCNSNSNSNSVELSNQSFYMVDGAAFKRGLFLNIIKPFMDLMASQYYRASHAFYAKRNMTGGSTAFVHFIQVLRHISKHSGVKFISTTKYEQSVTSKVYYIEKQ